MRPSIFVPDLLHPVAHDSVMTIIHLLASAPALGVYIYNLPPDDHMGAGCGWARCSTGV